MPRGRRLRGPRYFGTKRAYVVNYSGKRYKFAEGSDDFPNGPTCLAALAAYQGLLELSNVLTSINAIIVRVIFGLYA